MIEEEKTFLSSVFLTFKNKEVTKKYRDKNQAKINLFNKISFSLLGILSIALNIIILIKNYPRNTEQPSKTKSFYYIFLITSFILTMLNIIFFILSFVFSDRITLQLIFSCVSYCFITLEFTILKGIFEVLFLYDWNNYFFLNIIDYLLRIMVHFLGIVEFIQSIIINLILSALILFLYYFIDTLNSIISDSGATFIILNIGLIFCCYFITKTSKNSFYYTYEIEDLSRKKDSILNNLNTGYMRIKGGDIKFMNIALLNTIKNTPVISNAFNRKDVNLTTNSSKCELEIKDDWLYMNKEIIFDLLFGGIDFKPKNFPQLRGNGNITDAIVKEYNNQSKCDLVDSFLSEIASYYKHSNANNSDLNLLNKDTNSKFIFVDYQNVILTNNKKITYEISLQYDDINNEFDFIFNDITRTKEFEHKEYDIKIKNVFLTKIAHEFKNPLVSIQELTTQIKDLRKNDSELEKICSMVGSLCEYLLILIQDLDYFSIDNKSTKRLVTISKEKINLESLMEFCLINGNKRLGILKKDERITINYKLSNDIPREIYSDDAKLKQILINLLSNAIKFTDNGSIEIEIVKGEENDEITFSVSDTGQGISKSRQRNLLEPGHLNGALGIGLTIVKELTALLGKEISFSSTENQGSKFWFSIPINGSYPTSTNGNKKNINQKMGSNVSVLNSSGSTVKMDEFNLELFSPQIKRKNSQSEKVYNVVIADDEILARKALIRVITNAAKGLGVKINIIEARDGIELLYLIYENSVINQLNIDAIISDQTMDYINGSSAQTILCAYTNIKKVIPFFIVTAYDINATYFDHLNIEGIFSKPLKKSEAERIIENFIT